MDIPFSSRLSWPVADNELSSLRSRMRARGLPILDFSESNPTRAALSSPSLDALADPANLGYDPDPRGLLRAREALADFYMACARNKVPGPLSSRLPGAEELLLCASTSEAYAWLFKLLCDPGEAILVPKPGYPLFDYLAGLECVEPRSYRLVYAHPAGWRIDLDSVREALEAGGVRALVLINPNNPTGSYVRGDERVALLELCVRFGCALIADEVFFDFPVEGGVEASSFLGEDGVLCFVLDGLSKKLGLPQVKLGWIAASGPRRDLDQALGRLEIIADSYLSAGTPIMNALPRLLAHAEAFASSVRERQGKNLVELRRALEGPHSPHRVLRCEGGWTALIESPRLLGEEELALGLLREEGLSSHPGYFFDMEREAFFTASLILQPELLERGARAYSAYFERLQSG